MFKSLRSMALEPQPESRVRLRDVHRAICLHSHLEVVGSIPELFKALKESEPFQILFLSSAVIDAYKGSFIADLKSQDLPNEPLLVLSIKSEHRESNKIASLYLDGYDGFICDPYSADSLLELIQASLAHRASEESETQKEALASFLAGDASRQLDSYAAGLKANQQAGHTLKSFRNVGKMLGKVFEDIDEGVFASILLAKFKQAKPFEHSGRKKKGVKLSLVHPGELLSQLLKDRSISLDQFKQKSTLDSDVIDSLIDGKTAVDDEIAKELSRVLGNEAKQWLKLQSGFDAQKNEMEDKAN